MIRRKICLIFFMYFFSVVGFTGACPSVPTDAKHFCASFRDAAECHCKLHLPEFVCKNVSMNYLYQLMTTSYHSLAAACTQQHEVSAQTCIDSWNCYLRGGKDSLQRLCSATGNSCQ